MDGLTGNYILVVDTVNETARSDSALVRGKY